MRVKTSGLGRPLQPSYSEDSWEDLVRFQEHATIYGCVAKWTIAEWVTAQTEHGIVALKCHASPVRSKLCPRGLASWKKNKALEHSNYEITIMNKPKPKYKYMHTINGRAAYYVENGQIYFSARGKFGAVRLVDTICDIHRNEKRSDEYRKSLGLQPRLGEYGWVNVRMPLLEPPTK